MEKDKLFKKSSARKAHAPKFKEDNSKVKQRVKKSLAKADLGQNPYDFDSDEDEIEAYLNNYRKSKNSSVTPANLIASGFVSNLNLNEPSTSSLKTSKNGPATASASASASALQLETSTNEDGAGSSIKLKFNLKEIPSYRNLRSTTKPNQLNEDSMLFKNIRKNSQVFEEFYGPISGSKKASAPKVRPEKRSKSVPSSKRSKLSTTDPQLEVDVVGDGGFELNERIPRRWTQAEPLPKPVSPGKTTERPSGKTTKLPSTSKKCVVFTSAKAETVAETADDNPPPLMDLRKSGIPVEWDDFLAAPQNLQRIPPVNYFRNAPFSQIWEKIAIPGTYIELRNPFVKNKGDVYWIGTLVHFAGYKGLVKFETFEEVPAEQPQNGRPNYLVWISFCSSVPKPLGWCAKNGKKLMAGEIVSYKLRGTKLDEKLKEFFREPITHRTIPNDFEAMLQREFEIVKTTWNPNGKYEAMDLENMEQNRLVRVAAISGDRVHVQFFTTEEENKTRGVENYHDGYCFHWQSERLHKFMWSRTVGVTLNGIDPDIRGFPLPPETFPTWPMDEIAVKKGMRLETVHPYLSDKIVGAVILKVLNYGYFIIETCDVDLQSRVKFLLHVTSPLALPVGFGQFHGIPVESFGKNSEALCDTQPQLRVDLLPPRPAHNFAVGHKMEAFEGTTTDYLGPATVMKIAGHLLLLHFDGWREDLNENKQWVDFESKEIYPAGYCELVGFNWQGKVSMQ